MALIPEIADVRLVDAIAVTGSIGAAAAHLHIAQPSASQRLALLERRLRVALVERDTTGARMTPAGEAFVTTARRALALLEESVVQAQSPLGRHVSVGTIGSLAPTVFPALLATIPDLVVREVTNHGAVLARAVADGALDACVIGLEPAASPARGAERLMLGTDRLVLVQPAGAPLGTGSGRVSGATVVVASYANDAEQIAGRLARAGAVTRISNGTLTALAIARQQGWLAAVPRTTAAPLLLDGERVWPLRVRLEAPIWLITRGPSAAVLTAHAAEIARHLALR